MYVFGMHKRRKRLYQGPQNQTFNYIMRLYTAQKFCIYIQF